MKRSEAFWILNEMYELANEAQKQALNIAQRDVEFVDLMQDVPVQRWIPVTERLPEENGYYWCYVLTSAIGDKATYEQTKLFWEDDVWLYRHNSYRMCRNVTHWMPLPEPPKENAE